MSDAQSTHEATPVNTSRSQPNSTHPGTPAHSAPVSSNRFRRDPATWVAYLQLGLFAFLIDGYAPTVPLLAEETGLPLSIASLHGTAFGIGVLVTGAFLDLLGKKMSRHARSWLGIAGMSTGILVYVLSLTPALTLSGMLIAGFGGSLTLASANAELSERHGFFGSRAVGEGAAVSQGFGVLAPAIIGVLAATILGWRGGLVMLAFGSIMLVIFRLVLSRKALPATAPVPTHAAHHVIEHRRGGITLRFALVWVTNALLLGIEFSLAMWAPTYLRLHSNLDAPTATGSLAVMLLGMFIGRFVFARFTSPGVLDRLIVISIAVFGAGFALFWLVPQPFISLTGLFIAGLGIAAQSPVSLSRLIESAKGRTDLATAGGAVALGVALVFAPFALGVLGDVIGIRFGILLAPALALLTLALLPVTRINRMPR